MLRGSHGPDSDQAAGQKYPRSLALEQLLAAALVAAIVAADVAAAIVPAAAVEERSSRQYTCPY